MEEKFYHNWSDYAYTHGYGTSGGGWMAEIRICKLCGCKEGRRYYGDIERMRPFESYKYFRNKNTFQKIVAPKECPIAICNKITES